MVVNHLNVEIVSMTCVFMRLKAVTLEDHAPGIYPQIVSSVLMKKSVPIPNLAATAKQHSERDSSYIVDQRINLEEEEGFQE